MNKFAKIFLLLILLALIASFFVFSDKGQNGEKDPKKKVAVTISILGDLVKKVGGENIDVFTIIPEGVDPHDYEPNVSDQININDSSALLYVGMGFDDWAVDLAKQNENISLFDISLEPTLEKIGGNPHYWLSYTNGEMIVRSIAKSLSMIDTENAEVFVNNANKLVADIEKEREISLQKISEKGITKIITEHNAYQYLAEDLGLELLAVVEKDHSNEPLPQDLANINTLIKSNDIKSIFGEEGSFSSSVESIALSNNIKILKLDAEGFAHSEYLALMKYNVGVIIESLD